MRKLTLVLLTALVSLLGAASSGLGAPDPVAAVAAPPAKADVDGNKIYDDLEARLAGLGAGERVSVVVLQNVPATPQRMRGLESALGPFDATHTFSVTKGFAAELTKAQIQILAWLPGTVHVEENSILSATNDTAQQSFGVAAARTAAGVEGDRDGNAGSYSAADLVAAVIDTGIDATHVDLNGGKVLAFQNCVGGCRATAPFDDHGHGTHVAGTIAGEGEGNSLLKGAAPGAALVGVKVLAANGNGTTADITAGIDWVTANKATYGIEAINLSLSGSGCSDGNDVTSQAVNRAHAAGIVVAVAAGNAGPGTCTISTPSAAADALTVGAMADLGESGFKQAYFSSRGKTADGRIKPDVSAPGVNINSVDAGTSAGYTLSSGTSMASPFVAGTALLMLDANPGLSPGTIKSIIMSTAIDWGRGGDNRTAGTTGADIDYGAGRLDGYAAIQAAKGSDLPGDPPAMPQHSLLDGTLSGTGATLNFPISVTTTQFPIAATLIQSNLTTATSFTQDFDLYLLNPSGTVVAQAFTSRRQEEIGFRPSVTGTYTVRVRSFRGGGPFFVDVSAGMGSAPPPPPPPATASAAASAPATSASAAASASTTSATASAPATSASATPGAASASAAPASATLPARLLIPAWAMRERLPRGPGASP